MLNSKMSSEAAFAEVNGTRFKFELRGVGQPLVLLHAGIADMRMWDPQMEAFAEHFRVIRYDMRGYGETLPIDEAFSHHEDLKSLLDYLGISNAHLLGCSMGGSTIIDFALEYPEKAKSLVLVSSSPGGFEFEGEPPSAMIEASQAFKAGDIERASELEVVVWVDGPHRTSAEVDPEIRQSVRQMNLIALKNESLGLGQQQALDPPAAIRLAQIKVPVHVIVGALDDSELLRAGQYLSEGIGNAGLTTIGDAAHLPNLEMPDSFNHVVTEFLKSLADA